jgi:hypothetical protein
MRRPIATRPKPHPSRYPLRCAARRDLRGRSRGSFPYRCHISGTPTGYRLTRPKSRHDAAPTRKKGRAARNQTPHGPLPHHNELPAQKNSKYSRISQSLTSGAGVPAKSPAAADDASASSYRRISARFIMTR